MVGPVATMEANGGASKARRGEHRGGLGVAGKDLLLLVHQMGSTLNVGLKGLHRAEGLFAQLAVERGDVGIILEAAAHVELALGDATLTIDTEADIGEVELRLEVFTEIVSRVASDVTSTTVETVRHIMFV